MTDWRFRVGVLSAGPVGVDGSILARRAKREADAGRLFVALRKKRFGGVWKGQSIQRC